MATLNETRTVHSELELREIGDAPPTLIGYAATFGQPYDMGAFREVVDPGAFARTLGTKPDVRLLIDHEGQPLARTKSGTLELLPDDHGLRVAAKLDPTDPDVQRLLPKMRRGDLDQMSFAFRVPAGGDSWTDDYSLRTLRHVELSGGDVSVVTYPANPNTQVALRAADRRTAFSVILEHAAREVRAGKVLSAANVTRLQQVLDNLAALDGALDLADDSLDEAQAVLADVLSVADPDPDVAEGTAPPSVETVQHNSMPLALARRLAARAAL